MFSKVYHTLTSVLDRLCLAEKKHGLYVSAPSFVEDPKDYSEAIGFLHHVRDDPHNELYHALLHQGFVFILFDTAEERDRYFWQVVGESPSKQTTNPYRGPKRVFAYTAGPDGKGLNENC